MEDNKTQQLLEAEEILGNGIRAEVRQEFTCAIAAFERAAQIGSTEAIYRLAHIYATCADSSLRNLAAARNVCRARELANDPRAQLLLARIYSADDQVAESVIQYKCIIANRDNPLRARAINDLLELHIRGRARLSIGILWVLINTLLRREDARDAKNIIGILLMRNPALNFRIAQQHPDSVYSRVARATLGFI